MLNIVYKNCGSSWVVMLTGDGSLGHNEEGHDIETEREFFSFWNHGATKGEFEWMTPDKGYFWTTPKRLLKAYENKELFRLLNEADELKEHDPEGWAHCCKGIKGGFLPQAKLNAQKIFSSLTQQSNIMKFGKESVYLYAVSDVSAETSEDRLEMSEGCVSLKHKLANVLD